MAASYIEALLPAPFDTGGGGVRDWRWNNQDPLGTAFNLSFSFVDSVPTHASTTSNGGKGDAFGFEPITSETERDAVRAAVSLYAEIAKLTFTENPVGETGQLLFGKNQQSDSAGYGFFPDLFFDAGGDLGGDVWIDKDAPSNALLNPGEPGFATLIHEIGHALGLEHPGNYAGGQAPHLPASTDTSQYTVMSYNDQPRGLWREITITGGGSGFTSEYYYIEPSTPMLYDIAAIQHLYGKNMATRATNTVYDFETDQPFLMCIWDGGGVDTITVDNFSRGCTINLNAGKFSSISIVPEPLPFGSDPNEGLLYNGTNNLSIAFGCTIENATGGSGADRLTGNTKANTLRGNGGSDIIDGGKGNDKLDGGTGNDKLLGGEGNDTLTCQSSDSKIDGGAGTDTLKFTGTLDLVAITSQTKIVGIERIDMTGGIQTLTLGKNDVLDISSTTDTLTILGDAGDTIDLVGFTKGATSGGFVTWKAGAAIVKIDEEITSVV